MDGVSSGKSWGGYVLAALVILFLGLGLLAIHQQRQHNQLQAQIKAIHKSNSFTNLKVENLTGGQATFKTLTVTDKANLPADTTIDQLAVNHDTAIGGNLTVLGNIIAANFPGSSSGASGVQGAAGPTGAAGAKGATGLQGPAGPTGTQGPAGADSSGGGSGDAFVQGGNSFGTTALLGTNDANDLAIRTDGTERANITTVGTVRVGAGLSQANYSASSITYSPATLSGGAGALSLNDDEVSAPISLPFSFTFYGSSYSSLSVSSNGFITLLGGQDHGCCEGQNIPDPTSPNAVIAGYWTDLYPPGNGTIKYETQGTAPNRVFIIEYNGIPLCCGSNPDVTFQIKLFEGSSIIEVHTASSVHVDGSNGDNPVTQGIENGGGTVALTLPGRNADTFDLSNDGVRFTPSTVIDPGTGYLTVLNNVHLGGDIHLEATTGNGIVYFQADPIIRPVGGNLFLGANAGNSNTTGSNNFALGVNVLQANTTGSQNTALGYRALFSNTTGSQNIALGSQSLLNNTTGVNNIALGTGALYSNTDGIENVGIGPSSLRSNTTGVNNIALGSQSLFNNTTGDQNIALGDSALYNNTTGIHNIALGNTALFSNTSGQYNIAFGSQALGSNATGNLNTSIGFQSLYSNTTGAYNVAIGTSSLLSNNSGDQNVAIGTSALYSNTTGAYNIALGNGAMASNVDGFYNVAIGTSSLQSNTSGIFNSAMGFQSLLSNATGIQNTAVGYASLSSSNTGSQNTAFGDEALISNIDGSHNTAIGYVADVGSGSLSNATAIGANSIVSCSSCLVLGGTGGNAVNVGIGVTTPGSRLDVYNNTSSSNVDLFRLLSDVGGASNVKFRVDSDGDIFTDGSTTLGTPADVAENYQNNDGAQPGDVVVFSGPQQVSKASQAAQKSLAGVVSTKPGVLLSGDTTGVPVALSGRVPVKVSVANGPIQPGDYLTSAPGGKAQKATTAGPIIGSALESTNTDGVIEVFVHLGSYYPTATQTVQSQSSNSLTQDGSFSSLNVSGPTKLTDLTVTGSATFNGTLTVEGNATFNSKVVSWSNNIRGYNVPIEAAAHSLFINFGSAYPDVNYAVNCTPNYDTTCFVTNKTTHGFTLNFGTAAPEDAKVDWFVAH
ncbi:MAG TPA: hypothetical protein VLG25_00805 [Patescibacteria group bacterium]|nr:hypothetical protein [Patescibacteria group bacterium]